MLNVVEKRAVIEMSVAHDYILFGGQVPKQDEQGVIVPLESVSQIHIVKHVVQLDPLVRNQL